MSGQRLFDEDIAADTPKTSAADEIAADDAGAGALGRNIGQAAGRGEGVGDGSPEQEQTQGEIAADDAGATAQLNRTPKASAAD